MSKPKRIKGRNIHGVIVLNKPLGLSSNQALQRVKHLFRAEKAGHTGALDMLATGVLPICFGEATKLSHALLHADKAYQTTAKLGEVRSSGDGEGNIIAQYPVADYSLTDIEQVLAQFRGDVEQLPPLFSALKLNGKPLYELARAGLDPAQAQAIAEKKRRVIHIYELLLEAQRAKELDLTVRCSKGTYIRSLVEDIGQALGCGAYVSRLHRIQCGPYLSSQMLTLAELEQHAEQGSLDELILPLHSAVEDWPQVRLDSLEAERMLLGQRLKTGLEDQAHVQLWAFDGQQEQMFGIGRIEAGVIRAQRLFNL